MPTPATTTTSETTAKAATAAGNLVEQVSFQRIFSGLAEKGVPLSIAEQARLEEITRDEIRKQNGGQLIGLNIGGAGVNIIEILFSFIQKLFGGGDTPTTLAGWGDQLSGALSGSTNTGKQYVINTINANIYERMKAEGGNLAQAADLVTGFNVGRDAQGNPLYARDMDSSLMRQLTAAQNLNDGNTSSLNRPTPTAVADNSSGSGLPASATRPLTPTQRGA